jgi:8-oxo-dGTP pyrophosphatase MutT (NUDIX family)
MVERWKKLGSRPEGEYRIFRLRQDLYLNPRDGSSRDYVVLELPDWVNVVPITDEGQVVLIRQFRHGIAAPTLEVPGGMVDGDDGDPAAAALRECREETGYACAEAIAIGAVHPNPAFQENVCHSFLAPGAHRVGDPQPDPGEVIEVELHPLSGIPGLIASGAITHSLVVTCFYWLDRWMHRHRGTGLEDGWR